jgi:hypothetical protein
MNFREAARFHKQNSEQLLRDRKSRKARRELERAAVLRKAMELNREVRAEKRS